MKIKHLQDKDWVIIFGIQTVYIKAGRQRITRLRQQLRRLVLLSFVD